MNHKQNQNRSRRAQIAQETLEIMEQGHYANGHGRDVSIKEKLELAVSQSILYRPSDLTEMPVLRREVAAAGAIEVTAETSLEAARRLIVDEGVHNTSCLNFASAKNPGGGFLNGSQA